MYEDLNSQLKEILRTMRINMDWSMNELAFELNVDKSLIWYYESSEKSKVNKMGLGLFAKWCNALQLDYTMFMEIVLEMEECIDDDF